MKLPGVSAQDMLDALTSPEMLKFYQTDGNILPHVRRVRGLWFWLKLRILFL